MRSMHLQVETTPNPATLKFLPGVRVMPTGTHEFASAAQAATSPLAAALFEIDGVERVFFGSDFVSVTQADVGRWDAVKADVLCVLLDHFTAQMPLFDETSSSSGNDSALLFEADPDDADIVAQILDLVETRVRPAVANDGGDIVYRGFKSGVVYLQMRGACAGCPSSTATLKQGIEQLLKYYVPEVTDVRAI